MKDKESYFLSDKKFKGKIILTGDRPTGKLHLGHYVGSLITRVNLQHENHQYLMIADLQALTDNMNNIKYISSNIKEVLSDYLASGIKAEKTTIFLQSKIPALSELSTLFLNCVTLAQIKRNPTLKEEIKNKYKDYNIPLGFLCYPVSQVADIVAFNTDLVPVGSDQLPMIEQSNQIVKKINSLCDPNQAKSLPLKEVKAILTKNSRLIGIDGKKKMSKSLGNAIYLSDDNNTIRKKVFSMYTDPNHIRISDPGNVQNNVVFKYLDIFMQDREELEKLKKHYEKGGLSDTTLKDLLFNIIKNLINPIREKRKDIINDKKHLNKILSEGIQKAKKISETTLIKLKNSLNMY